MEKGLGIILKRTNYKDADRILTLYTNNFGKIDVLAKGIRKITSKRKSLLEPMNIIKFNMYKKYALPILTQTELIESFPKIKSNYEKINSAYFILEVFEKIVPEEEIDKTLLKFLAKTLQALSQTNSTTILNAFSVKILNITGFFSQSDFNEKLRNPELQTYLQNLLNNTYEDIVAKSNKFEAQTEHSMFKVLKNLLEETLEMRIKTNLSND